MNTNVIALFFSRMKM